MSGQRLTSEERRFLADQVFGGAEPSSLIVRAIEQIIAGRMREVADEILAVKINPGLPSVERLGRVDGLLEAERIVRDRAAGVRGEPTP